MFFRALLVVFGLFRPGAARAPKELFIYNINGKISPYTINSKARVG